MLETSGVEVIAIIRDTKTGELSVRGDLGLKSWVKVRLDNYSSTIKLKQRVIKAMGEAHEDPNYTWDAIIQEIEMHNTGYASSTKQCLETIRILEEAFSALGIPWTTDRRWKDIPNEIARVKQEHALLGEQYKLAIKYITGLADHLAAVRKLLK